MHAHELLEGFAAVALVTAGAFFLPASWLARRRALATGGRRAASLPIAHPSSYALAAVTVVAASLSLAAASMHAAVIGGHPASHVPFGAAFAIIATLQAGSAVALLWRPLRFRGVVIALNVGIIGVWIWSRTLGLPIGPDAGAPEPIGVVDLVATAFEAALIALLVAPVGRLSGRASGRLANVMSVAVVPLVGMIGIAVLIVLASSGGTDGHEHEATSVAGQPSI